MYSLHAFTIWRNRFAFGCVFSFVLFFFLLKRFGVEQCVGYLSVDFTAEKTSNKTTRFAESVTESLSACNKIRIKEQFGLLILKIGVTWFCRIF